MTIKESQSLILELKNLRDGVLIYQQSNDYYYAEWYKGQVNKYNKLLEKYNASESLNLYKMGVASHDLSSTQKTVREATVNLFIKTINNLIEHIEKSADVARAKVKEKSVLPHQMRRCFKTASDKCSLNPKLDKRKIFIAMPFNSDYHDSYEYGIKLALESLAYEHYRADMEISNKDIMCKICCEIQTCEMAIVNISGHNPNVMLELGLIYGLGKSAIIVKDKKTPSISDLGSVEYIEYEHAGDLREKLFRALS